MPTIFDNIDNELAGDLVRELSGARKADFSVGYLNLKGWGLLVDAVQQLEGEDGTYCRLLIGMSQTPSEALSKLYGAKKRPISQSEIAKLKEQAIKDYRQQLMYGAPTGADERVLRRLQEQLKEKRVQVKLFARHPLHAKLYIAHKDRDEKVARVAYLGSSNLTFSGLKGNGELNVDVLDQDATAKLHAWFQERWDDDWCIDLTEALQETIEESWVSGPVDPYHVYIKTAWHLSHDVADETDKFILPKEFRGKLLEHQEIAVKLSGQRLNSQNGVIIGDVVGLGKTLVATAVAKMFCNRNNCNVLVICPPALVGIWDDHIQTYCISGKVMSIGMVKDLEELRRYHLVIIDEGHKLRNRDSTRYKQVKEYIERNESSVMILTATPYNKDFLDMSSQLMLFTDPDRDLGIMPENHVKSVGGVSKYQSEHSNTKISSLRSFENSVHVDDWRELMRLFMVRRTRKHIKENYAKFDEEKRRHYLEYSEGNRFYIPDRETRRMKFPLDTNNKTNDAYAMLFSDDVIEAIAKLKLPRYGLQHYVNDKEITDKKLEEKILGLSKHRDRLRGFQRVNLFKRLESSGSSFIISLKKHVLRNALSLVALSNGRVLIGEQDLHGRLNGVTCNFGLEDYREQASLIYDPNTNNDDWEKWLPSEYFNVDELKEHLKHDMRLLITVLNNSGEWNHQSDRKLDAFLKLCQNKHPKEKVLLFSEFKDTVEYIFKSLKGSIDGLEKIHGGLSSKETQKIIKSFSPISNKDLSGRGGGETCAEPAVRVLLATDKLSEGVNLQDAHIVVNYDLPWALIKFAQRVGRVDRIGQNSDKIFCYCALPEEGLEGIIKLRKRLKERIISNHKIIGSDEEFFDVKLEGQLTLDFEKTIDNIEDEDDDDESDLVSYAYDIWKNAIKKDKRLENTILNMPDMVYTTKNYNHNGVIVYCKDNKNNNSLLCLDEHGAEITRSQYKVLRMMACPPSQQAVDKQSYHYDILAKALDLSRKDLKVIGGHLGTKSSTRRRLYEQIRGILEEKTCSDQHKMMLTEICEQLYHRNLKTKAKDILTKQVKAKITQSDLILLLEELHVMDKLLDEKVTPVLEREPKIKCSMGLVNNDG